MREIGLTWTVGTEYGWGTFGYQIASVLAAGERWRPVLLREPGTMDCNPLDRLILQDVMERSHAMREKVRRLVGGSHATIAMPLLHALGNSAMPAFSGEGPRLIGDWNGAITFLESTSLRAGAIARFNRFDKVIAGSNWVREVLRDHGVGGVTTCLQGVDPTIFHPAPRRRPLANRFLIFSGGKFEFRKAQDAVVAAFKIFQQRHRDAVLVAVWGNAWAGSGGVGMFRQSNFIDGPPPLAARNFIDWPAFLEREGLPAEAVAVFDTVRHTQLAHLIRECDVALFPNRAEGGTNLVAMEAMACGVPTILSANTGHLDIMGGDCAPFSGIGHAESAAEPGPCLALTRQTPVPSPHPDFETEGWGEPDVEEIVAALEFVYQNRARAEVIAQAGAAAMRALSWEHQIAALMAACELE